MTPRSGTGPAVTWIEKYFTYEQTPDARLVPTDNIFLAEVIYLADDSLKGVTASLHNDRTGATLATYDAADLRAFTNGYFYTRKSRSFADPEALDRAFSPTDELTWRLDGGSGPVDLPPMRIGGAAGRTQPPAAAPLTMTQGGQKLVGGAMVDPQKPLTVSFSPFEGVLDQDDALWKDLNFFLVDNCRGDVVFTGGAPGTDDEFLTSDSTSCTIPANSLASGMHHVAFLSQVKFIDATSAGGIDQLAANSYAVELPFTTSGARACACPSGRRMADYRFSRKNTDSALLQSWPTLVENYGRS